MLERLKALDEGRMLQAEEEWTSAARLVVFGLGFRGSRFKVKCASLEGFQGLG